MARWLAHPRRLTDLLVEARAWLASHPVLSYVMVRGVPVQPTWCGVCQADRPHDLLVDKSPKVPDFLICMRCGNGVAAEDESELVA